MQKNRHVETAVLLAAGRGTRLRPITDNTPKPLLPHNGKATLDYVLDSLKQAGIGKVCIVTHHLAEQIERHAKTRSAEFDAIQCVPQASLAGTADALETALQALPGWFEAPFVLTATDYIVPLEFYPELLQFHRGHAAHISLSLKEIPQGDIAMRSSVRFGDNGEVLEVVEKPAPGTAPSNISANLVFILPSEILPYVRAVEASARGEREVQSAVNHYLARCGAAQGLLQATPPEWQAP